MDALADYGDADDAEEPRVEESKVDASTSSNLTLQARSTEPPPDELEPEKVVISISAIPEFKPSRPPIALATKAIGRPKAFSPGTTLASLLPPPDPSVSPAAVTRPQVPEKFLKKPTQPSAEPVQAAAAPNPSTTSPQSPPPPPHFDDDAAAKLRRPKRPLSPPAPEATSTAPDRPLGLAAFSAAPDVGELALPSRGPQTVVIPDPASLAVPGPAMPARPQSGPEADIFKAGAYVPMRELKKRREDEITFVDVKQADITARRPGEENTLAPEIRTSAKPNKVQHAKHHITSLLAEAQDKQAKLEQKWRESAAIRLETRNKYGWAL